MTSDRGMGFDENGGSKGRRSGMEEARSSTKKGGGSHGKGFQAMAMKLARVSGYCRQEARGFLAMADTKLSAFQAFLRHQMPCSKDCTNWCIAFTTPCQISIFYQFPIYNNIPIDSCHIQV